VGVPIVYRADKALGCTVAIWDGDLTSDEMHEQLVRLANDPEWQPGPSHLIDATTLGKVILPDPELVELLYEGTSLVKKARIAVLVSADFFDGDRPLYETAAREFDAATFTDLDTACAYLGLRTTKVQFLVEELRAVLTESTL
jgi:hypothetical protein